MSIEEARKWIDQLREIGNSAAMRAEEARERLAHAEADGDSVLAILLRQHTKAAEKAAQDVHLACDQMEKHLEP